MSGGRYNYVLFKVDDEAEMTLPVIRGELEEMERDCRLWGKHEAADEIMEYRLFMYRHIRAMIRYGKYMKDLLEAVEWTASSDWGPESIDRVMEKLNEGKGNDSTD